MKPELSSTLRRLLDVIDGATAKTALPAAARARDRLVRDLLPRTVSGAPYLVVGIVGPNNSGKSALFNAIAKKELSPSLPTGGATRRLFGAASSALVERLLAEPTLGRFAVVRAEESASEPETAATDDPGELLLFPVDLPEGLLVIDTPDFDSVLVENRLASESLLAVADLAVAVVTRHTYQNREVVRFLERWLAHGRPWLLVYNEAPSPELALEHSAKLAGDLGHEPLAVFAAPHSLAVQEGKEPLTPASVLEIGGKREVALSEFLVDVEHVAEVKQAALRASLFQLIDDLREWSAHLDREAERTGQLLEAAEGRVRVAAENIGSCAMPGGPFIEAFRTVLDRRSNAFSRRWRFGLRKLRLKLEGLPSLFTGRRKTGGEASRESLTDVERAALERAWPEMWEGLARDLGPEGRIDARSEVGDDLRAALDRDLAEEHAPAARERAAEALAKSSMDLEAFQDVCEVLVEEGIAERGRDWDIQAVADVTMLAPIAIAAAVIIKTGGLGSDVGVAGGAALSSYLFEKYSHLLGTRITNEAARRWAEQRASEVLPVLVSSVLPESTASLSDRRAADRRLSDQIRALAAEIQP